jgi:hypothetical protein
MAFWAAPFVVFLLAMIGRLIRWRFLAAFWIVATVLLVVLAGGGGIAGLLGIFGSAIGHALGRGGRGFWRAVTSGASTAAGVGAAVAAFLKLTQSLRESRRLRNSRLVVSLENSSDQHSADPHAHPGDRA